MAMERTGILVDRVLAGDLAAFETLVLDHHFSIRAFFAARLPDLHAAEDLAQETFLAAFRTLKSYDKGRPFIVWLRGIAGNRLLNYRRKAQPTPCGASSDIDVLLAREIEALAQSLWVDSAVDALHHCLDRLDDKSRNLLQRRYVDEQPIAQIRAELRLKHSNLTMLLHRLRVQLKDCVERQIVAANRGRGLP